MNYTYIRISALNKNDICIKLLGVTLILFCIFLCFPALLWSLDARHVHGDATEGVMLDYFKNGGWQSKQGQVGRQGIDGLFVKKENGVVKDVLFVESKHGKSKLGINLVCGKQQMSQSWLDCKLDSLIKDAKRRGASAKEIREYEQIKTHVQHGNYRGRLWKADLKNGKLSVDVQNVKSKGDSASLERLSGGERYKIQSRQNTVIDLKNPKNSYQQKIADDYFKNLDRSLKNNGVPDAQRARMMRQFRKNPARISRDIHRHALKTAPQKSARKSSKMIAKRVKKFKPKAGFLKRTTKGFAKRFVRNLKGGIQGGAAMSWGGPIGIAAGFIGGIGTGMATDYLVDSAVDKAYAHVAGGNEQQAEGHNPNAKMSSQGYYALEKNIDDKYAAQMAELEAIRQSAKKMAQETQNRIVQVEDRMVKEFSILGQDIQNKHEVQMAAIGMNLEKIMQNQEISLRMEDKLDTMHTDLHDLGGNILSNMQSFSRQMEDIAQSLDSISNRINMILERLDATIKASYDSGVESLDLYENTGEVKHLIQSLDYFTKFINTFENIDNMTVDEKGLLLLARYYRASVYAELYERKENAGYAHSAVQEFNQINEQSSNLELLIMTYLSIVDTDIEGHVADSIYKQSRKEIIYKLLAGEMDAAIKQAEYLTGLLNNDKSQLLYNAVSEYVSSGKDSKGLIGLKDSDYVLLMSYIGVKNSVSPFLANQKFVRNILYSKAKPIDYYQLLQNYQSSRLVKYSVRQLLRKGYYNPALQMLNQYTVNDDTFRTKAYLLIFRTIEIPKYRKYSKLVMNNPTYSEEAKSYAKRLALN